MILKGNQRGHAANLAVHLMSDENELVEVLELRGFAGGDLMDALLEVQAISRATQCQKFLYSLSLSPPKGSKECAEDYIFAAEEVEKRLGLEGQPRAIVRHIKDGRPHAHAVW
ncbi:MAG: hypothetical protein AAF950_04630 [Pseudomonadota bacterium]